MQGERYYSVRMRAALHGPHEQGGKHISGGELLCTYTELQSAVHTLLEKGINHSRGNPDFMQIQFELIREPIAQIEPLPIKTHVVDSVEHGRQLARELLEKSGLKPSIIEKAWAEMSTSTGIRGAILIDTSTGKRLDTRQDKGVRVSRMDWLSPNFEQWAEACNMPKHPRIKEALVLATKVSKHPATIAELCWSDDPEYTTGYVASKELGYQRISQLKEAGDERGCRIFFVDGSTDVHAYIHYLEKQPVFIHWGEEDGENINRKK